MSCDRDNAPLGTAPAMMAYSSSSTQAARPDPGLLVRAGLPGPYNQLGLPSQPAFLLVPRFCPAGSRPPENRLPL